MENEALEMPEVYSESKTVELSAGSKDFLTVGIGASAGGIKPLQEFFAAMPADSEMAFVVILHLSPEHESQLPAVLQTQTKMPVVQVRETVKIEPDHVYVIPPTKHLAMVDGEIRLIEPDKIRGKRVPIDLFFRTLADAHGKNGVCVVLSGTGADGTSGLKRVKEEGGLCIVQDPAEAEYDGMPTSAIATNLVDLILPVGKMPAKILDFKRSSEKTKLPESEVEDPPPELGADALQEVLAIVKAQTKHDFFNYKKPTILRRVARRLLVHGLADIPAYVEVVRENKSEVQSLLRDLLISVTNFFRDKEAFAALEAVVIPRLFEGKTGQDSVRVWCVACATGEEAYSLGMLLSEYAAKLDDPPKIQIFASDIAESSITEAREARYDETIIPDVSPERLRQFFTKEDDFYRVKKDLREMILFTSHNILHDPPFSQQDLVTCRNLLIYLSYPTQVKVMEVFHFALRQKGYLFLGASEMAESVPKLFAEVDKKQRIYQSRPAVSKYTGLPVAPVTEAQMKISDSNGMQHKGAFSFKELHLKYVEQISPPSVLIDENYEILHLSESAGRFLRVTGGDPTHNLGKITHQALRADLLAALFAAKQEKGITQSRHLRVKLDGKECFVNLTVHPITTPEAAHSYFLVVFDEISDETIPAEMLQKFITADKGAEAVIQRLEEDLQFTRDRLRQTVQQHEVSLEEARASNEELQASNEELRSTTEELETSKEELQSVNEELVTVNAELENTVQEVNSSNLDLSNLMASIEVSSLLLDLDLHIKRFTAPVQSLFNIRTEDIGRPLTDQTHRLDYDNLSADAGEVLRTLKPFEHEIKSKDGRWHCVRIVPYYTADKRIDGVLITFEDITDRKQGEAALRESEENFRNLANSMSQFAWIADANGYRFWYNARWFEYTGTTLEEMLGWGWEAVHHPNEIGRVMEKLKRHIASGEIWEDTFPLRSKTGEYRWFLSRALPIRNEQDEIVRWFGTNTDIEDLRRAEEKLKEADRRKDEFLATLAHELRNPLAPIRSGLEVIRRTGSDYEKFTETLDTVERQTNQIVHLVDDLLDISRISQGKIKLRKERIELKTAIEMALETSKALIDEAENELTITLPDEPLFLDADLTRIAQIFLNILNNAAKYSNPGGKISLVVRKEENQALISIKDTGFGIAPEMIPKIFEMFGQIETTEEQARGGLGIGLSVVKKIVEMHGGTVEAFSDGIGKGSEFIVRLPIAAEQSQIIPARPISETDIIQTAQMEMPPDGNKTDYPVTPKQYRILVIDDNRDAALMLEALLSMQGHIIRTALDGKTAIETAKEFEPEICLSDIGLPGMNGYELATKLREMFPQALLISISGWGQEEDRRQSKEAGFDYHLVKPVDFETLNTLIGGQ
jgi:two-component system, chemotaxis family, CheB/CheR fusion protein